MISSSTLVTDSTTPFSGIKKFRQIAGLKHSKEDRLVIDGVGDGDEDDLVELENPEELSVHTLGLDKDDKMSSSDSNTSTFADISTGSKETGFKAKRFSSSSAEDKLDDMFASVSDKTLLDAGSNPDSFISSEISLTAKLSGPMGMTIGLTPVALNRKGTEKDRENSTVPDRSKWTVPAIESLKEKNVNVNETKNESLIYQKKCSKSN